MLVGVLFLFTLFGEGCGNDMNDDHAIKSVLQEIRSLKEKVSSLEERLTKSEQENELLRKHQRELQRNTRQYIFSNICCPGLGCSFFQEVVDAYMFFSVIKLVFVAICYVTIIFNLLKIKY